MTGPAARALAHVRGPGAAGHPPVPGARITVSFHPDRRLPDGRSVAEHLARDGAAVLGHAARVHDPQLVKYLWHILVLRGHPRESS